MIFTRKYYLPVWVKPFDLFKKLHSPNCPKQVISFIDNNKLETVLYTNVNKYYYIVII